MARLRDAASNPTVRSDAAALPYLALEHIEAGAGRLAEGVELERLQRDDAVVAAEGDALFGKLRPYLCKVVLAEEPLHCSSELLVIRPDENRLNSRFLYYLLMSKPIISWAVATSVGVKMPRTDWPALSKIELGELPRLEEQSLITQQLDDELASLDRLVFEQRTQRLLLEERFRTLLVERFIAKDRSDTAGMVRLKHLFEFDRGGIWGDEPTGGSDDVICVRVADFDRYTFRVGADSETRRSVPEAQVRPRLLRSGDVLLEKSGGTQDKPVGCAVTYEGDERAVCSNFVTQLRPRSEHNARFVGLLMAAHYQAKLNAPYVKQTTGIQNLDSARYLGEYAFVPDRATQDAIVAEVERELDLAVRASSELDRSAALLNERKIAIITAAVTGQMEVP